MAFITWEGSFVSNPLGSRDSHIVLANANVANQLVLSEFQDTAQAYQLYRDDYRKPDGRSFAGAIKIKGVNYSPPRHWVFSLLANDAQAALLEALLDEQPAYQSTLIDSWDSYSTTPIDVVISVAEKYRSRLTANWNLLQFECLEEI